MDELKKVLPSGANLTVQYASFPESEALRKAVMKELVGIKVSIGAKNITSLKDIFDLDVNDQTINTFKDIFATLLSSEIIEAALWPCAGRAIYNKQKVTPELFENVKARGDYLLVMKEILFFNMSVFFSGLGLKSSTKQEEISNGQK